MHRALLLLSLVACGGGSHPAPTERPPDVLLVVIDTLRADRLGCYGYDRPTSPTLDRLAREGALFLDASAQSSWTRPSIVSLMQGRYITDYRDVPLEDTPTLAELFRAAGYRTLAFVGNALLSRQAGFDRGWRTYDARRNSTHAIPGARPGRDLDELLEAAREPVRRVLRPGRERQPVLLYLHVMDPHDPYEPRPWLDGELPREDAHLRWTFDRQRATYHAALGADPRADGVWERMAGQQACYDQEIRNVDDQLGALLADLETRGAADDLVVVVLSDHGEGLWTRLDPGKPSARRPDQLFFQTHGHYLHQELLRTPLVLWGAGVPAGVRVEAPVENVDLLPTLLDLCGIEAPPGLHGRSLTPWLAAPSLPAGEAVHAYVLNASALREVATGLKLVQPREGAARLYDLSADPLEREDLAARRPGDVARLVARLEAWRAAHPLTTTLGRARDARTTEDMRAMGYAGDDEQGADGD